MIQGRLAALGGVWVLAALGAAGMAAAQPASDLPPVDHPPFIDAPRQDGPPPAAADESSRILLGAAHVDGLGPPAFWLRRRRFGDAWLLGAAGPPHSSPPHAGFGPANGPSWSSPPSILHDMPNGWKDRNMAAPPVARYSAGEGSVFVLDRSSGVALLKFEDSPEIWVLRPTPAPRGDVIYKNDMGEPILRATRLGGLTLFSASAPGGEAAAMVGTADDLQPPPFLSPSAVFQHMLQSSARASRAAQHLITFDAADVTPDSAPVFADAATAAAEAVIGLSRRDDGKAFLRRLDKMQFQPAARPGAALTASEGGAHIHMQVFVDPAEGPAGRPSSERLMNAALGK